VPAMAINGNETAWVHPRRSGLWLWDASVARMR
jgi:hypothetical protein